MKRSRLVLLAVVAAIGGGIAWRSLRPAPPTRVTVAAAERVPLLRSIVSATGEIRAKEFVDIQAEVPGVIVELLVREGDQVREGDVLLKLEDLQLQAGVELARAQVGAAEADARSGEVGVATAEANLAAEETALANARVEAGQSETSKERAASSFRRQQDLFDQGLIGREAYEVSAAEARLAQQRLEFATARIRQAEANVRAAVTRVDAAKAVRDASLGRLQAQRASLTTAIDQASKTVIRAPLSGLITACNVEKGERAVPGIQSNPVATLMTIADMSVIEAEIEVGESDIVAVELGAAAEVEVDAIRDLVMRGVVTEIGQSPIPSVDNQEGKEFKVVVRLDDPPKALRPGFTATAEIVTATRADCLVIPLMAMTRRERERGEDGALVVPPRPVDGEPVVAAESALARMRREEVDGVFVMIEGEARFRPIETGITGDMDIEVLAGLSAGERVVIGPNKAIRELREWDAIAAADDREAKRVAARQP